MLPRIRRTPRSLAVAVFLGAILGTVGAPDLRAAPARGLQLIALDAGHSIKSRGAVSARGVAEFEFNRALVLAADQAFTQAGVRTVLVAVEGRTEDLVSRPRQAHDAGAQLFVSIHHDSAKARFHQDWVFEGKPRKFLDDRFRGFSLFVSRNNPQWPLALKCASAIGASLIATGQRPSRYHADPVLGNAREYADEANGVHFFDNLAVLRNAVMPAVLFEAGVIVNRDDEREVSGDDGRKRIAAALAAGALACMQ